MNQNETQRAAEAPPDPRAENERLRALLGAVLLFHRAEVWDTEASTAWVAVIGTAEANTRTLCDAIRAGLDRPRDA